MVDKTPTAKSKAHPRPARQAPLKPRQPLVVFNGQSLPKAAAGSSSSSSTARHRSVLRAGLASIYKGSVNLLSIPSVFEPPAEAEVDCDMGSGMGGLEPRPSRWFIRFCQNQLISAILPVYNKLIIQLPVYKACHLSTIS